MSPTPVLLTEPGLPQHGEFKRRSEGDASGVQKKVKIGKRKYKSKAIEATAPLGVLQLEIQELLETNGWTKETVLNDMRGILNDEELASKYHREVNNVEIIKHLSNGDGLAVIDHPITPNGKQIVLVPFGMPGDVVDIKVFKSHPQYAEADLLRVVTPSVHRDESLARCKYFGKCSGCQYQNVEYEQQLLFKKHTIENAYKFFAPELTKTQRLPPVDSTQPSPLQYGYRTKLTPHFNMPYRRQVTERPHLGFASKGRPTWRKEAAQYDGSILDIEECVIGTQIINMGMSNERQRFNTSFNKYKKGATILLRENTKVLGKDETPQFNPETESTDVNGEVSAVEANINDDKLVKTCVTETREIVTEYINGYKFKFSAGEFFQNNNSILPIVTSYVRENLKLSDTEPNYLVDAYCGSGLFSITCSSNVSEVIGVEVSADSVKFAEINAKLNNIKNSKFIVGKAEKIFGSITTPAANTSVILDPPRKGCDDVFLNQLSDYNPCKIIYISCNVHSQARDVEWFINHTPNGHKYEVESIKGFDFFPQTHHVESVAILKLK